MSVSSVSIVALDLPAPEMPLDRHSELLRAMPYSPSLNRISAPTLNRHGQRVVKLEYFVNHPPPVPLPAHRATAAASTMRPTLRSPAAAGSGSGGGSGQDAVAESGSMRSRMRDSSMSLLRDPYPPSPLLSAADVVSDDDSPTAAAVPYDPGFLARAGARVAEIQAAEREDGASGGGIARRPHRTRLGYSTACPHHYPHLTQPSLVARVTKAVFTVLFDYVAPMSAIVWASVLSAQALGTLVSGGIGVVGMIAFVAFRALSRT